MTITGIAPSSRTHLSPHEGAQADDVVNSESRSYEPGANRDGDILLAEPPSTPQYPKAVLDAVEVLDKGEAEFPQLVEALRVVMLDRLGRGPLNIEGNEGEYLLDIKGQQRSTEHMYPALAKKARRQNTAIANCGKALDAIFYGKDTQHGKQQVMSVASGLHAIHETDTGAANSILQDLYWAFYQQYMVSDSRV